MTRFRYSSHFDYSAEELFDLHCDVRNLPKLSPPGQSFELLSEPRRTEYGDVQRFFVGAGPFRVLWEAEVTKFDPPRLLEDVQNRGIFRKFQHQHQVFREGEGSRLTDVIAFRLFPTVLGEFVEWLTVRPVLYGLFRYRHRRTKALLAELRERKSTEVG